VKMTLCRTKDGRYLRAASREAAPEGSEVVEVLRLSLQGLQAAISVLAGRPCGRPQDKPSTQGLRTATKPSTAVQYP